MTEQAKYLLRAPKPDMDRWKTRAKQRGRPFSEHIRASLDLIDRCPTSLLHQLLGDPPPPIAVGPCAMCGRDPAAGFAKYGDEWFCHGDGDPDPTCYMKKQHESPVEAAAAAVEGPAGAAASTGGGTPSREERVSDDQANPAGLPSPNQSSQPVASSEERADLVQTPAGPPAPPEPVINRTDLIDEARRLAGRMRR